MRSSNINIPNIITIARIIIAPIIVIFLLSAPGKMLSLCGAIVFALASITDFLDGYIARRMNSITTLGKFLDPLADKLLVGTALIMMIHLQRVPPWIVALIVGREIFITGLRVVAIREHILIETIHEAKYKTALQIVAVICLIIHYEYRFEFGTVRCSVNFHDLGMVVLIIALIITLWTGAVYTLHFIKKTTTLFPSG
ncbi:MAG: CDP-diacylglycerol--glycerol-3-phosphate 3-phosphatidyltransferase [Desulfobacterota bacterium]|nr:CDP-diacylglycerol--glycerol-3-phosphate 3-phosphatidyltransferase [Thermodesulfobacteriota bacterium]